MAKIKCANCRTVFVGRENRETCSVRCRRGLEYKRRKWDRIEDRAIDTELQAIPGLLYEVTDEMAEAYRKEAAAIRRFNGERP